MDDWIDDAYESKCSHPSPSFEAAGVALATCLGKGELYFFDEGWNGETLLLSMD